MAISLLFYGTANSLCSVGEAQKLYPSLGIFAQMAVVVSGVVVQWVSRSVGRHSVGASLYCLVGLMAAASCVMYTCKCYLTERQHLYVQPPAQPQRAAGSKAQQGAGGGAPGSEEKQRTGPLALLQQNRSLLLLAVLVACYGLSHKLFEFTWKGHLRSVLPAAADYQSAMAQVQCATGVVSLVLMAAARLVVFPYLGWSVPRRPPPCCCC